MKSILQLPRSERGTRPSPELLQEVASDLLKTTRTLKEYPEVWKLTNSYKKLAIPFGVQWQGLGIHSKS